MVEARGIDSTPTIPIVREVRWSRSPPTGVQTRARAALASRLSARVEGLHPAYFAFVMATGIVAVAVHLQRVPPLAYALTVIGGAGYVVLWAASLARVALQPEAVLADLSDHGRGVAFFTTVAATGVLGAQFLVIVPAPRLALGMLWIALVLWLGLTYGVFAALTVKERKPRLSRGIHGGWLLAVVATESVANLAALLLPHVGRGVALLAFLAVAAWLAGGMLYIWIISLIFYRYTFFSMPPSDLMPP